MKALFLVAISMALFSSAMGSPWPMQPLVNKNDDVIGFEIFLPNVRTHEGIFITMPQTAEQIRASEQLGSLGLYPVAYGNRVLGLFQKPKSLIFRHQKTIGLGFSLADSDSSLILGETVHHGLNMNFFGNSKHELLLERGLRFSDPLSLFFKGMRGIKTEIHYFEEIRRILDFLSRIQWHKTHKDSLNWPERDFPELLKSLPRKDLVFQGEPFLAEDREYGLLKKIVQDFEERESLEEELVWKVRHQKLNDQIPLWDNVRAQSLMQRICDRIYSGSRTGFRMACRVTASLNPDAYSFPGGDLFISAGMILALRWEASLVWVIAHEASHVLSRHTTKSLKDKAFRRNFSAGVAIASSVLSIAAGSTFWPEKIDLSKDVPEASKIYLSKLIEHSEDHEIEADRLAMEILAELNHDPYLAFQDIERLFKLFIKNAGKDEPAIKSFERRLSLIRKHGLQLRCKKTCNSDSGESLRILQEELALPWAYVNSFSSK